MNPTHYSPSLLLLASLLIIVQVVAPVQGKDKDIYFAASRVTSNENGVLIFKNEPSTERTYGKYEVSVENGGWVPKASIDHTNNAPTMVSQDYRKWIGDINASTERKKVLVYVHGFRNSFIDAVESAAILTEPMETVVPIVYSWPASKETPTRVLDALKIVLADYHQAEDVKEDSAKDLKAFLNNLGDEFGPENVSVVAHSFGNSVTLSALKDGNGSVRFRNLIMVAPDVRRDEFVKTREEIEGKVGRVSIYFAEDDLVLKGSTVRDSRRWANGSLGNQKPGTLFNSPKTDVIDSSFMCFTFGGHSYHTSNRRVRDDITNLVDRNKNASARKSALEEKGTGSKRWFTFKKKERIREAENRKNIIRATGPIAAALGSLFK